MTKSEILVEVISTMVKAKQECEQDYVFTVKIKKESLSKYEITYFDKTHSRIGLTGNEYGLYYDDLNKKKRKVITINEEAFEFSTVADLITNALIIHIKENK